MHLSRFARLRAGLRTVLFVYCAALVATIGSERIFWFWTPNPLAAIELAAFYSLPMAATLGALQRLGVASVRGLVLACPIFAYVTEGVITPVLYSGGPFVPVFPLWFTGWHGLLAFCGLVFGMRALLLRRRLVMLGALSVGIGVFWGLWSTTLALPENVNDPELIADQGGPLHVLTTGEFAAYTASFVLILVLGHWALGRLWPPALSFGRPAWWLICGLCLAGAALWTVAYPWALPMFVGYVALQRWAVRRVEARHPAGRPLLVDTMAGHVRLTDTWPLLTMAPAAASAYAIVRAMEVGDRWIELFFWSTIGVQTVLAAAALVWAVRPFRNPRPDERRTGQQDHGVRTGPA